MLEKFVGGSLVVVGLLVIVGLLVALPVMLLWNWLCPMLFGLPLITFWQALGIFALCRCLWPMGVNK